MSQLEMFTSPAPKRAETPSAESVRLRLNAVLGQLRDGTAERWSDAERRRWFVVFPQMCAWLPDDERAAKQEAFRALWPSEAA